MQVRSIGSVARLAVLGGFVSILVACGGGGGGEAAVPAPALQNANPLTLSGSIGDGPVIGATVTVLDSRGASVVAGVGDGLAGYRITVRAGTSFPITVTAVGGTDLVTGRAPDFDLKAVLLDPTIDRVNVSPFSSLALAIANCGGQPTTTGVANAWTAINRHLSMGMDPARVPNPANGLIGANNIADIVLANEALGEALRRTAAALAGTSAAVDTTTLIQRLGCDLLDGNIDGAGGSANARTAATFAAASAGVMFEVIAGTLQVNGSDAMGPMDASIRTVIPGIAASVTTLSVPVSDALIDQARDALALMITALPDSVLLKYSVLLGATAAPNARAALNGAVNTADLVTLDGLAARVAVSDNTQITAITGAVREQAAASAPIVSFAAAPESIAAGGTTRLSWSSSGALRCEASGAWAGEQPPQGSFTTGALQAAKTYGLSCVGLGGTTVKQTTVQVSTATPPSAAAPVTSLTASPASITSGGTATLTWSTTNADTCVASGGWSGTKAVSGTQSVGPLTVSSSFSLACTGAGGTGSATATVVVQQPAAAPTLSFAASPLSVVSGGSSTLTWSSSNASSCVASGDWTGTKTLAGSATVGPLTAAKTYTLACTGGGGTVSQSASVTIAAANAPTLTFAASPTSVQSGAASQLTWSTTSATGCTASGAWSGTKGASGTQSTGALTANANYTLSCTGAGGSTAQSVAVTVIPAPTLTFAASPSSVQSGAASQLTWTATNATSCSASGGWSGGRATSGAESTGALTANASYTLSCVGPGGTVSQTAAVTLLAAPTMAFAAAPTSVQSGSASQLTWSTTNATGCTASGSWSGTKGASGTQSTGALTADASYILTCTGAGGSVARTAAVAVTSAAPTLTLSALPTSVQSGSASQLTWSTTNATSCAASGGWSGAKGTSGTQSTGALTANSSFTLACTGAGGSVTQAASVTITAGTPALSLTASPPGVARNANAALTWVGTNVSSCTASGAWTGSKAISGTESVGPITQDSTYSLNCSGAGGNAVAMTTVSLREAQLSWQAPTKNVDGSTLTNLAGYKIYYGTTSKSYAQSVSVSGAATTQWTLSLAPGTYYFALTALDTAGGESSKTNEVSKTVY